ncbi:glycosyltransferase family 1 protein, partial [Pseudomonas aeruginosa]
MHIADMTMFYAPASGGVRTYLEAKHRHLWHYPGIRHSVLVPGA